MLMQYQYQEWVNTVVNQVFFSESVDGKYSGYSEQCAESRREFKNIRLVNR